MFPWVLYCSILAVAHAGDVADEAAVLIGDAHLDGGDLVVVGDADGLGGEGVAQTGAGDEHHAAATLQRCNAKYLIGGVSADA